MSGHITNNQRETIQAIDTLAGTPFVVKGNSATGSIYVEAKNALASAPSTATAAAPTLVEGSANTLSTDLSGNLRVLATIDTSAIATSANQTNGTQKTKIVDGSGNVIAATSNALNVNLQNASVAVTGTFWQATQPISGTVTTTPPSNASSNISQINAVTPLMGNGPTGTGSLRVTIASDNTAFAVNSTLSAETTKVIGTVNIAASQTIAVTNAGTFAVQAAATLAAETTKVIGTVRTADGTGNLYTTNSTTYTAKFGQDSNLLGTLGTAFSTAGKVDVKGADGDVFVRQATGTNLHTVLDSGTLTGITNSVTVTATNLSTNTAQINGVTPLMGNGASGTGAQRVTVASDSTGQIAPAANATATGTSIYNNTALSSTKQAVNASAGNLYGYHIYNPNSVVIYIQLFNVASGSVTVGSTTPTAVLAVPALGWADAPPSGPPITFGTALTIAATTTATGSTAPTTALLANFWYK